MRLNEDQTEVIKTFIRKCGVTFDDIAPEICDHMCSQTEELMDKGISFETGFEMVRQRWSSLLRKQSSLWTGPIWSRPKIVLMKYDKIIKKIYLKSLLICLCLCAFLFFLVNIGLPII